MSNHPSFTEALKFWLKLGFISFGGPAGQIAIMHEYLVDKMKWISEKKFLHALNYCILLPGPEAQQLATYMGWLLHGARGGIAAGLLFILPSAFILLALSILYVKLGHIQWIYAIFNGLKPAVIAIVILALVKIAGRALKHTYNYIVAAGSFAAIYFFDIPFPLIILGSLLAGSIFAYANFHSREDKSQQKDDPQTHLSQSAGYSKTNSFDLFLVCFGIAIAWIVPFVLLSNIAQDPEFWKDLIFFFTKAALVTFGGAYAVLPYVAQVSVDQFGWLSRSQMVDGLALGETTPGPLIMVLGFVGFMAAYGNTGSSVAAGSIGLVVTIFYTFLPSFLFVLAGAPLIERARENEKIVNVLEFVTSAVVGVILNLCVYLGVAVLFPEGAAGKISLTSAVWIVVSLAALWKLKLSIAKWIMISAIFGIVVYLIGIK